MIFFSLLIVTWKNTDELKYGSRISGAVVLSEDEAIHARFWAVAL